MNTQLVELEDGWKQVRAPHRGPSRSIKYPRGPLRPRLFVLRPLLFPYPPWDL